MKRWQIVLGIFLLSLGFIALIETLFDLDLWRFIWPLILVGLGLLLILRPTMAGRDVQVQMIPFSDLRMKGSWQVGQHELWTLVGSARLDFTDAVFPQEAGAFKIYGFVPDVRIIVPEDVGLRVVATSFVSEVHHPAGKQEQFLTPLEYESENFSTAEKQVTVHAAGFVCEIRIKPSLM
jgi:lia operon protein LiaF